MSSNENLFPIHDEETVEEGWQLYGGRDDGGGGSAGSKGQFIDLGDANSSSEPVTIGSVDDTSDRINKEEAVEEDWQVYGGTGVSGDGSAGSKGQFVDLGDANSSSDPVTIGGEEAAEEDWQVYGGTGVSGDGSAGSKGQFVDLTPKETDA